MTNYSELDKVLHRQFLSNSPLSNYFYERLKDKSVNEKKSNLKHIFITGLARSGTTALLNKIYSSNEVGSFLYSYMPFILSPRIANIFSKISKKESKTFERFHKDGILINQDSPEALDEIFWIKSLPKESYLSSISDMFILNRNTLKAYDYFLRRYSQIQKKRRLVIKNNNNHIRIKYLAKYFTKSFFLIIFRDPLAHSQSLLNQHLNFIELQNEDPFILEYMKLIGHREFGIDSLPFSYSLKKQWKSKYGKENINYWLMQWIETHRWFIKNKLWDNENLYLIPYEYITNDGNYYKRLCKVIGIYNYKSGVPFISANNKSINYNNSVVDLELKEISLEIYNKLKKKSFY